MTTRKELEKLYENFIGSGKVHSLSLIQVGDEWEWKYKEKDKYGSIKDTSREFLEQMHLTFGGKNPDTCRASDKFLELNKWNSGDLQMVGHRITKVLVDGRRTTRKQRFPISLPIGSGSNEPIKSKRNKSEDEIVLILEDLERASITRAFTSPEQFDEFKKFITHHPSLKDLTWYIRLMGTESRETKDQCLWVREKVGDGTQRMALELVALNGKHFTECKKNDLINAADDMMESECKRVGVKKPKDFFRVVCFYAVEDGKLNIDGYEADV